MKITLEIDTENSDKITAKIPDESWEIELPSKLKKGKTKYYPLVVLVRVIENILKEGK